MAYRVAIGPSSFADADEAPKKILEQAGLEIIPNPYGRRLTEEEIISHLSGVDGLIAGLEPLNSRVLETAPELKVIARVGIGMDNVDIDAARDLGIKVSNTPEGPTEAVVEMCLSVLLTLQRRIVEFNSEMHHGIWKKHMGLGLGGINVLLVGYGRIGRRFEEVLHFFGANVLIADPFVAKESLVGSEDIISLEDGLARANVVSIHASGRKLILGEEQFRKMKKGTVLLNSARGELVDEKALVEALKDGTVASAWLDTFWEEPYSGPLIQFSQVLLTPHVCTYTRQCRRSMEEGAVRNLLRDLKLA